MSGSNNEITNAGGPASSSEPSMEEILASIRRILKDEEVDSQPAEPGESDEEDDILVLDSAMVVPRAHPPEPAAPEPAAPQPEAFDLAAPELAGPELAEPELAEPELTEPEPAAPEPAAPEPAAPEPTAPEPAAPELAGSELAGSELAEMTPILDEPEETFAGADPEATEPLTSGLMAPDFLAIGDETLDLPPQAAEPAEPEAATAPSAPEPAGNEKATFMSDQENFQAPPGLVSEAASEAAASSIGSLIRSISSERSIAIGRPGLTLEDLVREELRPLLKSWLDSHLPVLVERIVRAEIQRVVERSIV